MTHENILKYCLSKNGAYKDMPFKDDTVVVKVRKRIFAQLFYLDGEPMLTFNGDRMTGEFYRNMFPDDVKRGYHCPPVQQPYFNTVKLSGSVPDDEVIRMLDSSYSYVVGKLPKKVQKELIHINEVTKMENYKIIEGGVCAAKGFKASGMYCGIKENPTKKNDIAMIAADVMCSAAGVYTQNKVKGAPVIVTKNNLIKSGGKAQAVIVNSKNANTCNADGIEKAEEMCRLTADALGIKPEEVIVASTGVIGQILPIEPIKAAVPQLAKALSYEGNNDAAVAIMTTDTVKKEYAVEFEIGGKLCKMGGMAKGSGMIHPNMATTLNFITTDCAVSPELLQKALSDIVKITYNCLSVDGDQSTNDTCMLMSSGLAENEEICTEGADFETFKAALYQVMASLTRMLAKDGEGATKLLTCVCSSAPDLDTAIIVAKSVIRSPLFKCAMFGSDANWGRVLCAIGYAEAEFDIDKVDVDLASKAGKIAVCRNGAGVDFSEEEAKVILSEDEIEILISLNQGEAQATAWGCDLTYDYVKINGDYRS